MTYYIVDRYYGGCNPEEVIRVFSLWMMNKWGDTIRKRWFIRKIEIDEETGEITWPPIPIEVSDTLYSHQRLFITLEDAEQYAQELERTHR